MFADPIAIQLAAQITRRTINDGTPKHAPHPRRATRRTGK
jgi:hypothetical protein